jgi:hypothetical protein
VELSSWQFQVGIRLKGQKQRGRDRGANVSRSHYCQQTDEDVFGTEAMTLVMVVNSDDVKMHLLTWKDNHAIF